jgi:hypothetical protein
MIIRNLWPDKSGRKVGTQSFFEKNWTLVKKNKKKWPGTRVPGYQGTPGYQDTPSWCPDIWLRWRTHVWILCTSKCSPLSFVKTGMFPIHFSNSPFLFVTTTQTPLRHLLKYFPPPPPRITTKILLQRTRRPTRCRTKSVKGVCVYYNG